MIRCNDDRGEDDAVKILNMILLKNIDEEKLHRC
jgi:hypothetical protein